MFNFWPKTKEHTFNLNFKRLNSVIIITEFLFMCISCYTLDSRISHTSEYSCYVWIVRLQPYHYMLKSEKDDFNVGSTSHTQGGPVKGLPQSPITEFILLSLFAILITRIRINTGFCDIYWFVLQEDKKKKNLIRLREPLIHNHLIIRRVISTKNIFIGRFLN